MLYYGGGGIENNATLTRVNYIDHFIVESYGMSNHIITGGLDFRQLGPHSPELVSNFRHLEPECSKIPKR